MKGLLAVVIFSPVFIRTAMQCSIPYPCDAFRRGLRLLVRTMTIFLLSSLSPSSSPPSFPRACQTFLMHLKAQRKISRNCLSGLQSNFPSPSFLLPGLKYPAHENMMYLSKQACHCLAQRHAPKAQQGAWIMISCHDFPRLKHFFAGFWMNIATLRPAFPKITGNQSCQS